MQFARSFGSMGIMNFRFLTLGVLGFSATTAFSQSIFQLLTPGGAAAFSWGRGLSRDGSVVVGGVDTPLGAQGFRWTQATGIQLIGDLPGGIRDSWAYGISGDGRVVTGDSTGSNGVEAIQYTTAGGLVGLGGFETTDINSGGAAVSHDGSVIAGGARIGSGFGAAIWVNGAIQSIGDLPGGSISGTAQALSYDGTVAVGYSTDGTGNSKAFRWTNATGMVALSMPSNYSASYARDVTDDGNTIFGTARDDSAGQSVVFKWTTSAGFSVIGSGTNVGVWSASPDGSWVVGEVESGPAVYHASFGWKSMTTFLTERGLGSAIAGHTFNAIRAVTVDPSGNVVMTGDVTNSANEPHAFRVVAPVPEPATIAVLGLPLIALARRKRARQS
jgi:probable HAF family extracellular repeat protein